MNNSGRFFRMFLLLALLASTILAGCNNESIKVQFEEYEKAGGRVEQLKTAAVLDFLGKNPGNGEQMSDLIAERVGQMGYLKVMNRRRSRAILKEQGLPTEGIVSDEDAVKIAKALNVDMLIYGTADASFSSQIRYKEYYDSNYYYSGGKRRYRPSRVYYRDPYLNRTGNVTLNIHIFDSHIGKSMGKVVLNKSYNKDFSNYYPRYASAGGNVFYFDNQMQSPMPHDMDMLLLMTDRLMDLLVKGFTPYYVSRIRALQDGVPGNDLAKDDKWDEARKVWEKSFSGTKLDRSVNINLGIYYERSGNAARALTYYKKALEIAPGDETAQRYVTETERVKKAQLAQDAVEVQPGMLKYRVAEVKSNGRVYINAGHGDNVEKGDKYVILRPKMEFFDDLVTPKQTKYYKVADFTVKKVFDGISMGTVSNITPGTGVLVQDPVMLTEKVKNDDDDGDDEEKP